MPNRILKESICTSKELANVSLGAEVLFYRLIVKADDFGCYHGDPEIVRNTCFAKKKSVKEFHIKSWLIELAENCLIEIYTHKGMQYIHLATFSEHQQQRARNPKYPLPTDDSSCIQMISTTENGACNQLQSIANPLRKRYALSENVNENDMRDALSENGDKPPPAPPVDQEFYDIQKAVEAETHKPILSTDLLRQIGDYKDFGMPLCAFKYAAAEMSLRNADYSYFKKIIEGMFAAEVKTDDDLTRYRAERERQKKQEQKSRAPTKNNAESLKYMQRDYEPGELDKLTNIHKLKSKPEDTT